MTKFKEFFENVNGKADLWKAIRCSMSGFGTESFPLIEHRTEAVARESLVNWIESLAYENLFPSQWVPVLAPNHLLPLRREYLFLLRRRVAETYPPDKIRRAQLRSFIEIATNSSFLWVNRNPIVPSISFISPVILVYIIKQTIFTLVSWDS